MTAFRHRSGAFGLILLLALIVGGGASLSHHTPRVRAQAGGEEFTQSLPSILYVGDPSHVGAADADPTLGTNGYCIDVAGSSTFAVGALDGFTIDNGVILDTDYFDNGSADTSDDVYCAVVSGTLPNDDLPRPQIALRWTYQDAGGDPITIELLVNQVKVSFIGIDGAVGGIATVCTKGWDPTFLTGQASNTPPLPPNFVDVVELSDWTIVTAGVTAVGEPYKQETEWCLNMTSPSAQAGVTVSLSFYAVYDVNTELDDVLHTETATGIVEFFEAEAPELRHVDRAGNIIQPQLANPNVVGAPHTACAIPSVAGDQLLPQNIQLTSSDGATGNVLSVFHDGVGTDLQGVVNGTLCFTWTSTSPGREFISATVTLDPTGPTLAAGTTIGITWDTDGDRNDTDHSGPLVKDWYLIDRTEITTTGRPDSGIVTNGSVTLNPQFNAGSGNFLGSIGLNEWVIGDRNSATGRVEANIEGVEVELRVTSECGYFKPDDGQVIIDTRPGPNGPFATGLAAVTIEGRVPFVVSIDEDGCVIGDVIRVEVHVYYPGEDEPFPTTEFVDIVVGAFFANESAPQLYWVGQTATIFYGFAGTNCGDLRATFTKPENQPGSFVAPGLNGPNEATVQFDDGSCSATVQFESEKPGEVDIVATFTDTDPNDGVTSGDFSKVHFTLFYLEFEDISLEIDAEDHTVSAFGALTSTVRGWFPGTNLSARPQETKPDGRTVPAHRWVLPDDWDLLKGPEDFRFAWPSVAPMPPARITFFMENESTVNSFRGGVTTGASGFFVVDDDLREFDFDIHPQSRAHSALGSTARPRIISELSDADGIADVNIFGDFNLHFADCEVNAITGNPYCEPGDIAGATRYYVVADYTDWRGKHPQIKSASVGTTWTWAGYKRLSVVDTPDPAVKYLVAHLKDRDGFCDAINFNNTLGNVINFEFDAGRNGIILSAADRPFTIRLDKEQATATTFDTLDDLGNPINVEITQPPIEEDECQAWIKISNTLLTPINVLVTFPAPPVPLPGDLRVTRLVCGPGGYATVTNVGTTPVSLAGFGLRSVPPSGLEEEHLGLLGYLEPGQSIDVPGSADRPWLNQQGDFIFGNVGNDYARIVWNEFPVHLRWCDGEERLFDLPVPLPPDPEGEIKLDIVIPFGQQTGAPLVKGWNLVTLPSGAPISQTLGTDTSKVEGIYQFDPVTGTWRRYIAGAPAFVQTLERFESGGVYWVEVNQPFTLRMVQ